MSESRQLHRTARRIREHIVDIVYQSGSGHIGTALSQTDILVALYYHSLRIDPKNPGWPERDRFVLSKGHGGLGLAAVLADLGFFDARELAHFGETGFHLGMHMDHTKVPGIEVSTGSLGHGLGVAVGMALGARLQQQTWRTVCLLSDGELYEGSVWEAAMAAAGFGLDRLVAIVDRNGLTMDGNTETELPLEPVADKWTAFGWHACTVDGHDPDALCAALETALAAHDHGEHKKPHVIVARTIKGHGIHFMEGVAKWHYGALDSASYAQARESIAAHYAALGL